MKDYLTTDELGALLGGRVESIDPIGASMIDAAYLNEQRASLVEQRTNAAKVLHEASGAIALIDHLLDRLNSKPEPQEPDGHQGDAP